MPKDPFKLNRQHGATRTAVAVLKRMDPLEPHMQEAHGRQELGVIPEGAREELPSLPQLELELPADPGRVSRGKPGDHSHLAGSAELARPGMNPLEQMEMHRLQVGHALALEHVHRLQVNDRVPDALDDRLLVVGQRLHLWVQRQPLDLIPSVW